MWLLGYQIGVEKKVPNALMSSATYQICTTKQHSEAVSVYIPDLKMPILSVLQEICTSWQCYKASFMYISGMCALDQLFFASLPWTRTGALRVATNKNAPHCCEALGAENETRTRDPDLGKVVLYQLSYFRKIVKNFPAERDCKDTAKI